MGTFCVRVDHLLHMALRRDPGQRAHYQAHYAFIKAFQLPVGSSIMAACRLTYGKSLSMHLLIFSKVKV